MPIPPTKRFFQETNSDDEDYDQSLKNIESPAISKITTSPNPPKEEVRKIHNLQHVKSTSKATQKTVSFENFFDMIPVNSPKAEVKPAPPKKELKPAKKEQSANFSFFEAFSQPPKDPKSKGTPSSKPTADLFDDFLAKKEPKADKQGGLTNSNSQKLLQENIMSYDWLKNNALMPLAPPPKNLIDSALLNNILGGLKLR